MSLSQLPILGLPASGGDDLVDKLNLLRYQKEFCRLTSLKPLTRHYFTLQAVNPNEQFYCFSALSAWLIGLCGEPSFEMPGQFDDPNATAAGIIMQLKKMDIACDFPPAKLRQGYGDAVLYVLLSLVDRALTVTGFKFEKPIHKIEDNAEEAEVDNDAEITTENIKEDIEAASEDDDDMFMAGISSVTTEGPKPAAETKPNVDPTEWRMEVERVMPHLRVVIPNDNKDWRIHLEQMRVHKAGIESALSTSSAQLSKLHAEIERTLEKISSREKYINNQFEAQIEEYRVCQEKLSEIKQRHNKADAQVTELTNELSRVSEELDQVKAQMDEIGSGMTDSKPLVNIKQGLLRLKTEIKQMDLRLGVIEHTLLAARLRSKGSLGEALRMNANQGIFAVQVL